jgi:hypothetical protein
MIFMIDSISRFQKANYEAKQDANRFFVPELGGYLTKDWEKYIILARNSHETHVFEEYWGLWSAIGKTFSSWKVDSVIHALGSTREAAARQLQNADIIISTRYSTDPVWQPWNFSQNYWFYENLLRDWSPSVLSPTTIVWRKNNTQRVLESVDCSFSNINQSLLLNTRISGFYEVDIQYSVSGNGRFLVMLKNNISFGSDANGYISINPKITQLKFPVYVEKAGDVNLDAKIIGNTDVTFNIKSCTAKQIPIIDDEVFRVRGTISENFFVTDANWTRGIALHWTGFFMPNMQPYTNNYEIGKFVKFADGDIREIIRVEPMGKYLNVYLNGEPLNPEKVGLPSHFMVMDKPSNNPTKGEK